MRDKLTKSEEEQIQPYLEMCLKHGTSTEPADRKRAEAAVHGIYKTRNLAPPKLILWADSPKQAGQIVTILNDIKLPNVCREILGDYYDNLKKKPTGNELSEAFLARVHNHLQKKVQKMVNKALTPTTKCAQFPEMYGQHDLSWLGFYSFIVDVMKISWEGDLSPYMEMSKTAGWWMPFEDVVIICERHSVLKRDAENRLHCENGPAVAYPDGWKLYFWHGVAIPENWIEDKENLNPADALNWNNIEQRRCLAEIIGWNKIIESLNPAIVDEDKDPEIGVLLNVNLPDSPNERFLKVRCGTGRTFVLPVPGNMKTAREANAWTYGLKEGDLDLEIRT